MSCNFFKTRATKWASIMAGIFFAGGVGTSAALSLKLAGLCSSAVTSFITTIGTTLVIPTLTGVVTVEDYTTPFTLNNVTFALPDNLLDLINSTDELPTYCFAIPLTLGLVVTTTFSLALYSAIATAIHIHDQQDEQHPRNGNSEDNDEPLAALVV
ncbi:MAG: hypothetical protein A3F46_04780 [Legionellales bacterium RIFCSPHIGHO2_12_FULL_42_9]|nr:MAG: hypothetical protein A3F46_04780 [Legionellales bacterium RIFCSPHIGHO2_12_FULL_42_9]